ncbi:hypothetical protein CONCODRAFT_141010 [Conidiobolus coronatus NRRL 28638]|uniref:F-box domain-containing protein n=1 Tax=Conidiobolus coronatus (strain ATCC 28846 / CBS 209.66 / NRRL 28638) TaxID=796925 RepID=A0A137NRZ6_CONC2|nr:hypothetical protein CONCODRAFT_141010 [Conidiobolus coronatus NRRL 28638]|eukprot:KXN65518.1 hypothetical protein CONCODRAFT_141010 [Conidiobolus coronatus NRRL 28638]
MKNNKWIDVAILKEFFQYFNIEELAELSLCSKLFRLKLARVIFKIIKLDSLKIKKFGYKSCIITEKDSEYNDKDIEERVEHYKRKLWY